MDRYTAEDLLDNAEDRMRAARDELSNARDWLVGADVEMDDRQRERLHQMLTGIASAKQIIDQAKA